MLARLSQLPRCRAISGRASSLGLLRTTNGLPFSLRPTTVTRSTALPSRNISISRPAFNTPTDVAPGTGDDESKNTIHEPERISPPIVDPAQTSPPSRLYGSSLRRAMRRSVIERRRKLAGRPAAGDGDGGDGADNSGGNPDKPAGVGSSSSGQAEHASLTGSVSTSPDLAVPRWFLDWNVTVNEWTPTSFDSAPVLDAITKATLPEYEGEILLTPEPGSAPKTTDDINIMLGSANLILPIPIKPESVPNYVSAVPDGWTGDWAEELDPAPANVPVTASRNLIFHELVVSLLGSLNRPPAPSESWADLAKPDLVLQFPFPGGSKLLEEYIRDAGAAVGADVIRIDALDLAELCGPILRRRSAGASGGGSTKSGLLTGIEKLGFETYYDGASSGRSGSAVVADEDAEDDPDGPPAEHDGETDENADFPSIWADWPENWGPGSSGSGHRSGSDSDHSSRPGVTVMAMPASLANELPSPQFVRTLTKLLAGKGINVTGAGSTDGSNKNRSGLNPSRDDRLNRFLNGLLDSGRAKRALNPNSDSTSDPTNSRTIVLFPDAHKLVSTDAGVRLFTKLVENVQARRRAGQSIVVVGTSYPTEWNPKPAEPAELVRRAQFVDDSVGFRGIFVVPADEVKAGPESSVDNSKVGQEGTETARDEPETSPTETEMEVPEIEAEIKAEIEAEAEAEELLVEQPETTPDEPEKSTDDAEAESPSTVPPTQRDTDAHWESAHSDRTLEINIRHICQTVAHMNSSSSRPVTSPSDIVPVVAASSARPALSSSVLSAAEIQSIVYAIRGIFPNAVTDAEPVTAAHVIAAVSFFNTVRQTKVAWVSRYFRSQMIPQPNPETNPADGPKSDFANRLKAIAATATRHETNLLSGVVDPASITTSFATVHAPEETIAALHSLTSLPLSAPEEFGYGVLASEALTGLLLYGPPGVGKTLLAKAVANQACATVLTVSGSEINDMYVGEGEKNVKAIFSLARKLAPCIVFIDEADAIFASRSVTDRSSSAGSSRTGHRDVINQFLKEWDGLSASSPVVPSGTPTSTSSSFSTSTSSPATPTPPPSPSTVFLMVATNRPFDLDDAVLRRLPRRLLVDLPTQPDRQAILKIHLRNEQLGPDVDVAELAEMTPFYSGSDLKNVCVAAALACVRELVAAREKDQGVKEVETVATTVATTAADGQEKTPTSGEGKVTLAVQKKASTTAAATSASAATTEKNGSGSGSSLEPHQRRVLRFSHFLHAIDQIPASVSEDMATLQAIRKFDEQYGQKNSRAVWTGEVDSSETSTETDKKKSKTDGEEKEGVEGEDGNEGGEDKEAKAAAAAAERKRKLLLARSKKKKTKIWGFGEAWDDGENAARVRKG